MKKNMRKGQGLVEYVLLVSLIALVCVAILTSMGDTIGKGLVGQISENLDSANTTISSSP